jgi:hypothetical protein
MAFTGATQYDNAMNPYLNTSACVQIADGNTTCAAPFFQFDICADDACNGGTCLTGSQTDYDACVTASETGACATQYMAAGTACQADAADGGPLSASSTKCGTTNELIYTICGNGQ